MLTLLLIAPLLLPQDAPAANDALERLLADARTGSPIIRPQAAQRLLKLGSPAAERLLHECAAGPQAMADLGQDLVEVLGQFGDPRLRERLWAALADPDFPWRPAAARSLAAKPPAAEAEAFTRLLGDPLSAVRVAALDGIDQLDLRDRERRIRELLADPDDRVRRLAARLLDRFGDHTAVAWLLEDLGRDDRFFELETGKLARYDALRLLEPILGDRMGYEPGQPPGAPKNVAAIAAIREKLEKRAGKTLPKVPAIASAGHALPGDVLGLEVRSCRHGEFFLRFTASDELRIGTGNPVVVALPAGTVAALRAEVEKAASELADRRTFGSPGCDFEQFHFQPDASAKVVTFRVMRAPTGAPANRPQPLSRLAHAMLLALPDGPAPGTADPRTRDLRARLAQALAAVGGSVPESS